MKINDSESSCAWGIDHSICSLKYPPSETSLFLVLWAGPKILDCPLPLREMQHVFKDYRRSLFRISTEDVIFNLSTPKIAMGYQVGIMGNLVGDSGLIGLTELFLSSGEKTCCRNGCWDVSRGHCRRLLIHAAHAVRRARLQTSGICQNCKIFNLVVFVYTSLTEFCARRTGSN